MAIEGSTSWDVCTQNSAALGCIGTEVTWTSEIRQESFESQSYLDGDSFVFYILMIVALFIVLEVILYLIRRRKGKVGRYEGPDYIQYRRRI